jgi:thiol:disulfide interchange protein/DsbC/DsbD-like thiol-disulfide interchange protein
MRVRSSLSIPGALLLAFAAAAHAVTPPVPHTPSHPTMTARHVSVTLLVPPQQLFPGESFTAGLEFQMEPGWHVYWINAGDSGEPPAAQWTFPAGITAGSLEFPPPQRLPLGPLMDFGYENQVVFPVPMRVDADFHPSALETRIAAHLTWLVCREVCIPEKGDVSVSRVALRVAPAVAVTDRARQALVTRFESQLPKPLPAGDIAHFGPAAQGFLLDVQTGSREATAEFFPLDQSVIANAAPQPVKPLPHGVQLTLTKDPSLQSPPRQLNGLIELPGGAAYLIHATPGSLPQSGATARSFGRLAGILGFAFLGGMILNLMPCVFPVLFIKALALVQSSQQERRHLRAHGWIYTLGILFSFWVVVAILLGLRAAGRQLGWGFQFQSPIFLALVAMLLFFLGLALAGQFEIGLSLTGAGGSLAQKQGLAGSFFTGVLAMVVATPCTAPFMGAAIGYALAHSAAVSFAVFSSLALGLAAPYLVLAYFPAWARLLPKPGRWMETLKQAVSIPIFATVIWLVWVFAQVAGISALAGLLAAFLLLAIAGWALGRWPGRAAGTLAAALVLVAAIALPVWAVHTFPVPFSSSRVLTLSPESQWQPFTPALLAQERAEGRPVFVDFTASWCLSCQVNERFILDNAEVREKFRETGVALLRADWTDQNPVITRTLAALGRSGVPTYAIYPADPSAPTQVLPEVLTRGIVLSALEALPHPATVASAR